MKVLLLAPLLLLACSGTSSRKPLSMPEGYTYENLRETGLDRKLEEVSGIEYDGDEGFLAHNDEEGIIYKLDRQYNVTASLPFGKDDDYEELKKVNKNVYVLKSNGNIWSMEYDGRAVNAPREHKWPGKKAEFEAMFYDEQQQYLVLISKNAKQDKESRTSHGYAFYPAENRFGKEPVFSLSWDEAGRAAGSAFKAIHPSAAAIHPATGELYLLASIEKLLLILDRNGVVKEVHELDKKRFPQAEGITFDKEGNLYITNEAADGDAATLLSFTYQAG